MECYPRIRGNLYVCLESIRVYGMLPSNKRQSYVCLESIRVYGMLPSNKRQSLWLSRKYKGMWKITLKYWEISKLLYLFHIRKKLKMLLM